MKKITIALALTALTIGAAVSAEGVINLRQLDQERRIDAGHRSGNLTHAEVARLKAEQHAIAVQEDRMRARHGGHLTRSDKRILHARQKAAGHAISRNKYNSHRGPSHMGL
jgi:aminoglycoside phosphotransferase family enzyme